MSGEEEAEEDDSEDEEETRDTDMSRRETGKDSTTETGSRTTGKTRRMRITSNIEKEEDPEMTNGMETTDMMTSRPEKRS